MNDHRNARRVVVLGAGYGGPMAAMRVAVSAPCPTAAVPDRVESLVGAER